MISAVKKSDGLFLNFEGGGCHALVKVDKLLEGAGPIVRETVLSVCEEEAACDVPKEEKGRGFEAVLTSLKAGHRVFRTSWLRDGNPTVPFVVMMPLLQLPSHNTQGTDRKVNDRTAKHIGVDTPLNSLPYFAHYGTDKAWQPGWLPTAEDLLANDWVVQQVC